MSRRQFIVKGAKAVGAALLLGLGGGGTYLAWSREAEGKIKAFHESRRAEAFGYPVRMLANEADVPTINVWGIPVDLDYQGLPTTARTRKLVMGKVSETGDPARQGIILAERHGDMNMPGMIDVLVKRYGFDSVGVEAFWGPPSRGMWRERTIAMMDLMGDAYALERWELTPNNPYDDLVMQRGCVPAFGIEDKETFLKFNALSVYTAILEELGKAATNEYGSHDVCLIPANELRVLNNIMKSVKKKFPEDIPDFSIFQYLRATDNHFSCHFNLGDFYSTSDLERYHEHIGEADERMPPRFETTDEVRKYNRNIKREFEDLRSKNFEYWGNQRNKSWSETIPERMEEIGSKRPIIVCGADHVYHTEGPLIPDRGYLVREELLLQNILPFHTLGIASEGLNLVKPL